MKPESEVVIVAVPADHRPDDLRRRAGPSAIPRSPDDAGPRRQRPNPPYRHLLLRQMRRRYDAPHRQGRRARYRYYTCSIKARQGETGCEGRSIPMEKLDNLVASHLEDSLLQPERLETCWPPCSTAGRSARNAAASTSQN